MSLLIEELYAALVSANTVDDKAKSAARDGQNKNESAYSEVDGGGEYCGYCDFFDWFNLVFD